MISCVLFLLLSPQTHAEDRLEVLSGAPSPWSMQFILNYSGPSVEMPLDKYAPNSAHDPVPPRVILSGSMALRYRISPNKSLGLGTGVQVDTPFHNPQNFSMTNPTVDYSVISEDKSMFQLLTAMSYTDSVYSKLGYSTNVAYSLSSSWKIFDSEKWKVNLQFGGSHNFFQMDNVFQIEDSFGLYPSLDFAFASNWSLRTVSAFSAFRFRGTSDWIWSRFSQTLGAGWIWNKDLFLYGYVLFYPSPFANMQSHDSSLGLSVVVNLY